VLSSITDINTVPDEKSLDLAVAIEARQLMVYMYYLFNTKGIYKCIDDRHFKKMVIACV
jgi:hypothetical protein